MQFKWIYRINSMRLRHQAYGFKHKKALLRMREAVL